MILRQFYLVLTLLFLLIPAQAQAQGYRGHEESAQRRDEVYSNMVDEIYAGEEKKIGQLRNAYVMSSYYEPFPDKILDEMTRLAYTVKTERDTDEIFKAVTAYNALLKQHLGNVEVADLAIIFSEDDARLGNSEIFKQVFRSLLKSVFLNCDGKTPETACGVITGGEEKLVLQRQAKKITKSEIYDSGKIYYNVHNTFDETTGKTGQIYVNITIPIMRTQKKIDKADQASRTSIPKN